VINNPASAMRMLITYSICVPLAIFVGYLLTDQFDYSTLGILGFIFAFIFSPVFIKWHYPIMIFALGCPMYLFFLKGDPVVGQVMVALSLGIAIIERALNSNRRFISVPSMTWALFFTGAMVYFTAKMTGGFGLHTFGSEIGGGKKYFTVFIGIATFFALISRPIPKDQRILYLILFFLSGFPAFISDLFPVLPSPLTYINLLFPPSLYQSDNGWQLGTTRLGAFSTTAGVVLNFMLVRYGLRGIFLEGKLWRVLLTGGMLVLTFLGGFRIVIINYILIFGLLFYFEKLYRTRLLLVFLFGGILMTSLLIPFADKLPFTFQRAISFLPLVKVDAAARMSAEGSTDWRLQIWRDTLPKVPAYLWLGKGYALSAEDFQMMGTGTFAGGMEAKMDASDEALAIAGDYHSGPLSTLMPFGIWGAIAILWIMIAGMRIVYLNYKYGDPDLKTANTFLLAGHIIHCFSFLFIFGAFQNDVGDFAKTIGFSLALNQGICRPKTFPARELPRAKTQLQPQPA
jgi:hypothetical protein